MDAGHSLNETTWTDDDGITHDMVTVIARCFVDVRSRIAVPKNVPGIVTCLACLGVGPLDRVVQEMVTRGVAVNLTELTEMNDRWLRERLPKTSLALRSLADAVMASCTGSPIPKT